MEMSEIRLRDDEVSLSDYQVGDECKITINGILKGIQERSDSDLVSSGEKEKKSKEYTEYTILVKKAKEESESTKSAKKSMDDYFKEDKRAGKYFTKDKE